MQNTRLIQFLRSLNQTEIKQFNDFVNSPSFNKNKNLSRLFEILYEYYPEFDITVLSEEELFKIIFKNERFEYFKIKNLISDLFALGKEFLAFNIYKKDNRIKEKFLLGELHVRNLDTAFEQAFKNAEKQLEKTNVRDEQYFLHKMDLQFELMSYYSPKKPNVNFHYLQERLDLFVSHSLITLLKMYNTMLHENNQNNYNYDMKMFDNVMDYLEKNGISNNPTLEIYYYILLLEKTKDEKYFYVLKDLKSKYNDKIGLYDNYMLYLHMDGYCATAYNVNGRTDLLYEQFILAKENSMSNIPELGKILYPDFLNEVKKAVRVNEFQWAEDYIEKFKDNLTEEKENTLDFCYGYISYKRGELDKALDYFSKANFSNFILKIQVKILLLQLCIDKKYYEQADLMIDTFRHYLSREKSILDSIKTSTLEFLKITSELIKMNTVISDKDKDYKIAKIKQDIENMSGNRFGMKLWLKEKIVDN
ncbi:MAG: hypothetical protein IPL53_03785 [Ignavibacteria bacterium]|nr:hypothetical protein [Ignavibacteria bacterium]